MTINTRLPASDPLRFRKNLLPSYKNDSNYQTKILDKKIMQREVQYDLDRKAAKISAVSSKNLDKYEYLTGEELGLEPSTVEQARFEYSPLSKFFKGLKEEEQEEGPLKILKNIEGKNEQQLKAIEDQGKTIKCNQKHQYRLKIIKGNQFL